MSSHRLPPQTKTTRQRIRKRGPNRILGVDRKRPLRHSKFRRTARGLKPENRAQRARRRSWNRRIDLRHLLFSRQIGVPSMAKRTWISHSAQSDSPSISSWWSELFSSFFESQYGGSLGSPKSCAIGAEGSNLRRTSQSDLGLAPGEIAKHFPCYNRGENALRRPHESRFL